MSAEQDYFDKERRLRVLIEGKKSEHWFLIAEKVQSWISYEMNFLASFEGKGMSQSSVDGYNRAVDRIYYLKKLLNINDDMIMENKSIMHRLALTLKNIVSKAEKYISPFVSK